MELGLFARGGRLVVFCPKTFYRYDNVRKVCQRYGVQLFNTNDILFIAEKVCNYVGIDKEALRGTMTDWASEEIKLDADKLTALRKQCNVKED